MTTSAKRVLIVDDDPYIRELLREHLGHSYAVETAPNGSQAFGAMLRRRPDLIVLDLNLPGLPGGDVLRAFRELDATIPIVVITGQDNQAMADDAVTRGAHAYVLKPFDLEHLGNIVAGTLNEPPMP